MEITKEYLKSQGYKKKRNLSREEAKDLKIANYYYERATELSRLASAHINRIICTLTIENNSTDFEILDGKEVYVRNK